MQQDLNRRRFINTAGKGIIAGGLATTFLSSPQASAATGATEISAKVTPIILPPLDDASERKEPPVPTYTEPEKRIGFAVVGLGHLTLNQILPALLKSKKAKLSALVSGDADKAANVAAQYGIASKNIYSYKNFDDIKNNKDVQAIYIVLPNSMHEEYTIRAAKAGKHVLCEKPMTTSSAAAQRMIDACKQANAKLMIAYRIQYEPKNSFVKEWVRSKQKGNTKIIEMVNTQHIGDPTQWRLKKTLSGGGSLPDIGLYCLNTARFLLGEEPLWVKASQYSTPGDLRFKEVEEAMLWHMQFLGGAMVNCLCSYGVHETRRYKCITDKGASLGMEPAFPYAGLMMDGEYAEGKNVFKHHAAIADKDQFALELDHYADCIINNKTPYTPGEEGLQDQKIMEAIYESAATGRQVNLPGITTIDTFRGSNPEEA